MNLEKESQPSVENIVAVESHIHNHPPILKPFHGFGHLLVKEPIRSRDGSRSHTMMDKLNPQVFEPTPQQRLGYFSPDRITKTITTSNNPLQTETGQLGASAMKLNLPGVSQIMSGDLLSTTENIKLRVFAEYFSMIDDLVLVADKQFNIIANNHTSRNVNFIVSRLKRRFNQEFLSKPGATLDQLFQELPNDQLQCLNETVTSLLNIFSIFDYKKNKTDPIKLESYREDKIDRILKVLDRFDTRLRISNKPEPTSCSDILLPKASSKKLHRLKTSMRTVPVTKDNIVVVFC